MPAPAHKNIQLVYSKLSAIKIYSKDLGKGYSTNYKKLSALCEKYKIPYGFYYYSTCISEKEANLEYNWISNLLEDLPVKAHNLLPLAIDVEVHSDKDRQYNAKRSTVTSSKAKLSNLLEKKYGKTILYTSRNACDPSLKSRILDIEQYQSELHSGPSDIWFVSPKHNRLHQESSTQFNKYITAKQIALDIKIDSTPHNLIDLNTINASSFDQYISGEYIKKSSTRYLAINNKKEDFSR